MQFSQLESITSGKIIQLSRDRKISYLITDSRKPMVAEESVFFALAGERHDGHRYIQNLYDLGIRQFIVEKPTEASNFPLANICQVPSTLSALQNMVAHHRSAFSIPVVGITGSNGKTIIKEWLYQLLEGDRSIVKNPGSYNSQIGVPLSVWAIAPHHQLGIFEAGISTCGEMERLEKIIQPTIGIFTNIGTAHNEGFVNQTEKIEEKLKLFRHVSTLIYCADHTDVSKHIQQQKIPSLCWGFHSTADIQIEKISSGYGIHYQGNSFTITLPFDDKASVENCFHCISLLLHLGYAASVIQQKVNLLRAIPMRLELKQGVNRCQLIDDTYNNDVAGLKISLDFLNGQQKKKKTVILSDILQSGLTESELINQVSLLLKSYPMYQFIGIGPVLSAHQKQLSLSGKNHFYPSTEAFLQNLDTAQFEDEMILVKGARAFQFEKIISRLQRKIHGTVMEIDLNKMVNNLNYFKSQLRHGVKLMAMVKAFAYGSGSEEVANLLQFHQVDYLGVAYTDEGLDLRKNNISLPIMVMNPAEENFHSLLAFSLEPAIYNLKMLTALCHFTEGKQAALHIEVDTGMHRLGFDESDLPAIISLLRANPQLKIASVFSHLAGADESVHDGFSKEQFEKFTRFYEGLSQALNIRPLRHILNSPGILRFPDFQLDMVRLGIGLYGINPTEQEFNQLVPVATLKTIISQIKTIKAGETIGYGRKGKASTEMKMATIAIGYADGFSRSFSQGKGLVLVRGKKVPVVGNVCMDMTMIDVTGTDAHEGDEVILFGPDLPLQEVAQRIQTIPYEILTNTSERVKRVFFAESI